MFVAKIPFAGEGVSRSDGVVVIIVVAAQQCSVPSLRSPGMTTGLRRDDDQDPIPACAGMTYFFYETREISELCTPKSRRSIAETDELCTLKNTAITAAFY